MRQKPNLTSTNIENLRLGSLADPRTPGLYVEVQTGRGRITRVWKYRRRVTSQRRNGAFKATLGPYPAHSIADAREWASKLNASAERGLDPQEEVRREKAAALTVTEAHALYMVSVNAGKRRQLKPRTIEDKMYMWRSDIQPTFGDRIIQQITEDDLWSLVLAKGETARIRANRLAAELKVFLKWCASREGRHAGVTLVENPASSLDAYYFASNPRIRFLDHQELGWLLQSLVPEKEIHRRAILLLLLTGCRKEEVLGAPASEFAGAVWNIRRERTKNWQSHRIPLGPWALSLVGKNRKWLIPSSRKVGPRLDGWYKVLARVQKRMAEIAGRPIPHFTFHDLRRTLRSNTKRLKIDFETAEAMINHKKKGLEEIYDGYDLFEEKRDGFAKWESFIVELAIKADVAGALSIPSEAMASCGEGLASDAALQIQLL